MDTPSAGVEGLWLAFGGRILGRLGENRMHTRGGANDVGSDFGADPFSPWTSCSNRVGNFILLSEPGPTCHVCTDAPEVWI
jgi:hypothetical protein